MFNNNRNGDYLMELKYIFYITVNLCNGKFYYGVHKTNPDVFDGYIGDGIYKQTDAIKDVAFHRAVKKYGYENFKRTTIKIFPDTDEGKQQAFGLETIIVNETLLKSKTCYNTAIGGKGGNKLESNKRIYMFALNGNYLQSFSTARDAARFLETENESSARSAIKNCCLRKSQSAFGYFWNYKKEFTYESNVKKVAQYTLKGKFIRYFDSTSEAEETLHINTIKQAILKNYQAGGYQWRYYSGDDSDINPLVSVLTKNSILPIIMKDKNGTVIKKYESVSECVKENSNLTSSQINRVLKGIIKTHKGYTFEYDNSQDKDIV